MKVQMLTIIASPALCAQAGDVVEVDDEQGRALLDGGYAVAVLEPEETATLPAAEVSDPGTKETA